MKRSKPEQTRLMLQAAMITIVGIALFLVIYLPPYGWEATIPSAQTAPGDPEAEHGRTAEETDSSLTFEQIDRYLTSLNGADPQRDPFLSSREAQWKIFLGELKDRPPRLAGIITIEGTPVALIQGSHYRVGDTVQEFLINDIRENAVVYFKDGKTFIMRLTR